MATPVITVYGIPTCDTVRKARAWLAQQGVPHAFHDLRKDGLAAPLLAAWVAELGWEPLLNRRGTTWRGLDAQAQAGACDAAGASALMLAHPALIKRPVVDWGPVRSVGFDAGAWQRLASQARG